MKNVNVRTPLRNLAKLFLPPILLRILNPKKNVAQAITYTGKFDTFDEVRAAFKGNVSYNSEDSIKNDRKSLIACLDNQYNNRPPLTAREVNRLNPLNFVISLNSKTEISVLDVGGGFGLSYVSAQFSCPNILAKFSIIELPETMESASDIFQSNATIKFLSKFPIDHIGRYEVVHFGSSLQYFEAYKEILYQSSDLRPDFIVIASTPMGPAETFSCAQVNMAERIIPLYVFELSEIIELIENLGYKLIHKSITFHDFHNFSNYQGVEGDTHHYNLIFCINGLRN